MQARTSQWVLLKLESCCDVMKRLFSTAIKAGQHNVLAQEVGLFLEENGCNVGGCSQLGLTKDIAIGSGSFGFKVQFLGRYRS